MHLFCRIEFLHCRKWWLVQHGAAWVSPVCWHGDQWWRWRAGQQEQDWSVDSGVEHWGELICSPQKYMCKAISPHLKWLWVLYKEWNFRPINVCMAPQMTAGQTGGEQKGPPISSVYLLTRLHATQSCRSCAVSISVVSLSPLFYVLSHVKARSKRFCLNWTKVHEVWLWNQWFFGLRIPATIYQYAIV